MKKYLPYLIGGLAILVLVVLVILAPIRLSKTLDERVTLRQKDKIPYGTHVAFRLLPQLFKGAEISTGNEAPNSWAGDSVLGSGQLVFLTARYFDPTIEELRLMNRFIRSGNTIFIITNSFSYDAAAHFGVNGVEYMISSFKNDSLIVSLKKPPFDSKKEYVYPGKKFDAHFTEINARQTFALGTDENGYTNFLHLQSGNGKVFIHLAPLAFSNYFLLHKQNASYLENIASLLPANVKKVVWNEYYLTQRRKTPENEPNILSVLWKYPSFKWALITAIATLLLYTLIEIRRRQRPIPYIKPPVNDSLDFVRTLGRLYYDKGNHHNLARKMAAYFLDEIRTRYHISTQKLDADFITALHNKNGYNIQQLQEIVFFIDSLQQTTAISEKELSIFYQQLETYYQNT